MLFDIVDIMQMQPVPNSQTEHSKIRNLGAVNSFTVYIPYLCR